MLAFRRVVAVAVVAAFGLTTWLQLYLPTLVVPRSVLSDYETSVAKRKPSIRAKKPPLVNQSYAAAHSVHNTYASFCVKPRVKQRRSWRRLDMTGL